MMPLPHPSQETARVGCVERVVFYLTAHQPRRGRCGIIGNPGFRCSCGAGSGSDPRGLRVWGVGKPAGRRRDWKQSLVLDRK